MIRLSVIIPTFNEELNLEDCLSSVSDWAEAVCVLDSFSTDRTVEIANRFGARVVQHEYEGPALQKNWALDHLELPSEWVLFLDADERVPPELKEEIGAIVSAEGSGHQGYYLNRRFIFYGKWMRHCGWYPSWNLRLFKRDTGRYERREIHEHVVLRGSAGYCHHDLIHEDSRDLTHWIAKHNRYATSEAAENFRTLNGLSGAELAPAWGEGPVNRKRGLKDRILIRFPAPVRSFLIFVYMYLFRLGFLDGIKGFHFCAMHAVFEYFNGIKLWELQHYKEGAPQGGIRVKKVFRGAKNESAED